jgi:formylglycine-generating enzyme required for sulfatase activity
VLVTLRADFYAHFLDTRVSRLLADHDPWWLTPLDEQALIAAMYWPAVVNGYRFEGNDLFVTILRDAGGSGAALPLLSYALEQLAERADQVGNDRVMTWSAYRQIGGVQGVVEQQMHDAISGLPHPPSDETLGNLFRRLVKVNDEGIPVRKPAVFDPQRDAWTAEEVQLQHALVEKRLLRIEGADGRPDLRLEIAHDALLGVWKDLRNWIDRSRGAMLLVRSMQTAANEWQEARNAASNEEQRLVVDRNRLWRQEQLDDVHRALSLLGQTLKDLSTHERAFMRPEFERLVEELEQSIGYQRRAEIGERLDTLTDRRPGVGLRDQLPDIAWCPVPGGEVTLWGVDDSVATLNVEDFYVGRYPVTLQQFEVFTQPRIYFDRRWWADLPVDLRDHAPYLQRQVKNHPAQFVSWYQAIAFCRWFSEQAGYEVSLPTEWEWVQAVMCGDPGRIYPWGSEWDDSRANHRLGAYRLMSVGMYPNGRSQAGAYDLMGNMYEWCLNEYDNPRNVAPSTEGRTTRGGAFFLMPPDIDVKEQLSVRHRLKDRPDGTGDRGRRVAVSIRLVAKSPIFRAGTT